MLPMIDPDAIYTLKDCAAATERSYHRVVNAVHRGRLVATRNQRMSYQVRGADLIAWRDRVAPAREFAEPVYRPLPGDASPVSPPMRTPEEVRTLRQRLGLTQAQLAHRLHCTRVAVSHWETGTHAPGKRARLALSTLFEDPLEASADPLRCPQTSRTRGSGVDDREG